MAILRWRDQTEDPLEALEQLQREMSRLFDVPPFRGTPGLFDPSVSPATDVIADQDGYSVYCDLPGLEKEAIEVTVASGVLTIKGEKKLPQNGKNAKVYRQETWYGPFQRTISLPEDVDSGRVDAAFKEGVLVLRLPKREESKPKRIELKSG